MQLYRRNCTGVLHVLAELYSLVTCPTRTPDLSFVSIPCHTAPPPRSIVCKCKSYKRQPFLLTRTDAIKFAVRHILAGTQEGMVVRNLPNHQTRSLITGHRCRRITSTARAVGHLAGAPLSDDSEKEGWEGGKRGEGGA